MLLLIGYNWEALSRGAKLAAIFGALAATQGGAFYLRFWRQMPRLSEAAFLLGCLLYGAGIWLVAQVFHLDAHYPDGVWCWTVGLLPFARKAGHCPAALSVRCVAGLVGGHGGPALRPSRPLVLGLVDPTQRRLQFAAAR